MASFRAWFGLGASPGLVACLPLLVASIPVWGQNASVLQEVRFWTQPGTTRVALQTSEEVQFTDGRVQGPERVFVDLIDTRPNREFRGLAYSIPVNDERVKQIRVALNTRGTTRVVLDLVDPAAEYTLSRLTTPDRVVVEVRAKAAARPSTALGPSTVSKKQAPKPFVAPPPRKPDPADAEPVILVEDNIPRLSSAGPRVPQGAPKSIPDVTKTVIQAPAPQPRIEREKEREKVVAGNRVTPAPATARSTQPRAEEADLTPTPAQRDRAGNRSLTRVLGLKLSRIVIDPGHGGFDHGTTGKNGLIEKEVVLDVSLRLGKLLEEQLGTEVIYTRSDDTYIPLEKRTHIANDKHADLFLSIHANSSPYPAIAGVETYYLSLTAPREDLEVAARENSASQRTIGELNEVLRKIALANKIDESREFASRVQGSSHDLFAKVNGRQVRNRGIKKAPFVVLIGAEMPSVLTEIGFLTNAREEGLLKKSEHRQKIAEALFKGIVQYGESLSHFRVAQRNTED
ncbi:MAG: N-acetylmuramoyl-L-alanine amidase [Bryobacterales bacterium]|nr:N-acetylmuramoyl-L-alanine amidase [Bryobacterales bacterium]